MVVCVFAFQVAARGRLETAAAIAICAIWVELHTAIPFRGVTISSIIVFPALIVALGLLVGGRWAYRLAGLTTLSVGAAATAGHILLGTPSPDLAYEIYLVVLLTAVCFGIAALIDRSMRALGSVVVSAMASERRVAELVSHTPDGILSLDPNGTILSANPAAARLLGTTESDLVGRLAVEAVSARLRGDDPEKVARELVDHGAPKRLEVQSAGPTAAVVDATTTRFDRRDSSKGVQITLHDATESVRRQEHEDGVRERLEQANRLDSIGRLAGGVAHDFNNHLTVIGASAEMLMSGEEPDTKKLGRSILEAKLRAATLTTRLLAFARRDVVAPRVLRLHEVLEESVPLFRSLVGTDIRLEIRAEETPAVLADPNQIEHCMVNLISNASDALEGVGRVAITISPPGASSTSSLSSAQVVPDGFVEVKVEDSGRGMDQETQERAFEPFFTTSSRGAHSGLGLATVHGIVSQNAGHVLLESRPGEGTCVRIHWPVHG